jgi:hypothetical protein
MFSDPVGASDTTKSLNKIARKNSLRGKKMVRARLVEAAVAIPRWWPEHEFLYMPAAGDTIALYDEEGHYHRVKTLWIDHSPAMVTPTGGTASSPTITIMVEFVEGLS